MAASEVSGEYFSRGGKRIELTKEPGVVTFVIETPAELAFVRGIEGVKAVEPVVDRVFKGFVDEERRDEVMARVRASDTAVVVHHAYRPESDDATRYYLTDQLNAKFRADVDAGRIEAIVAEYHLRLLREYPSSAGTTLHLQVTTETGMNPVKAANLLAALPEVEWAEPNLVNRYVSSHVPSDPLFPQQWHLRSSAGPQVVAGADVSAVAAWDVTRGSRSVVVAVIDDGFDLSHPDFTGPGKVVNPRDYVDGDANPFPSTTEGDYHGTPCAGVAIAEENGVGGTGIAPGCAFMPVRFPLSASDNFLWEIFDFVGARADVISCSWGPPPVYAPLSQLMIDKFHELHLSGGPRKKGCLVFFAADNDNAPINDPANTGFTWRHPALGPRNTTGPILNGEASHPANVAVAASTSQNRKAAYSNWGPDISVCAPSNNFHPLNRQQAVPGLGITTTDNEQHGAGFTPNSRYTAQFGGTSSATPLAAGVAALVISANPNLTAAQVKAILKETADKIEDAIPDIVLGHQKGTYVNGRCDWFGFGRVNAAKAVGRGRAIEELPAQGPAPLKLRAGANGQLAATGASQLFRVAVGGKLRLTLDGPAGQDFDLYVKRNGAVSPQDFDVRATSGSPDESILIDPLEPGEYQVLVHSYRGSGNYTLNIESE